VISSQPVISQPLPFGEGRTVVEQQAEIQVKSEKGQLVLVPTSASLSDLVKALNAVGASPIDLLAILQAMKAAGALKAELEVI
jgi:flagellar P-ring protein precursor FlgI